MKKAILSLLMGSLVVSLQASDLDGEVLMDVPVKFIPSHHEIKPHFRVLRHEETDYNYTKILGGIEYKYFKGEGPNFSAFMGYSHTDHKTFFQAEWNLSYVVIYNEAINIYPIMGISNTSHFAAKSALTDYQIYCSKFNGGVGGTYFWNNIVYADLSLHYFKDIENAVVLHKGKDFWGKRYHSPYGLKAALELKFPNVLSKEVVVGGFYAQTIKKAYKEYGFNTAVVFAF